MYSLLEKIYLSFVIDVHWLRTPRIPDRWKYLLQKYFFLLFPYLYWNKEHNAYKLKLLNRIVYIPTIEHITFLQGTYIDHAYLKQYIKPNAVVIDVGAHAGEFALVCTTLLNAQEIYSFEPLKKIYELLRLNTPYAAYHAAVGTAEHQTLYIPKNTVASSIFQTSPEDTPEESHSISLDGMPQITRLPHIDLLKIDVEGMEYDVLMASKTAIKKSSYICIEVSMHRPSTKSALDTLALIKECVPNIQIVHIGTIFPFKTGRQVAVDILLHNPAINVL
ncbi:MAG: hypothetical protein A3C02_00950 [Candidatus Andersenbacteria bacterium RIFCSPHIGHO2_02_FULL_45_11]|uniref:Methyltransferase FkbM domain-containing protein n=1 Tax=Candidatus Andersenbacteria bacterium RIFCSPHIGHO2_12_FULL_45_11 TaxID=1797281 RepID=A0A1G1WZG2_9BACT|nr:MAG: hypothetical protein A2805_00555 [Candidatus Andersenbacteria bacterium RIFCSPHIGHO2_01_FULL_46_36]OGY33119.1 MAG: hypothetical protein A3D99_01520 [Candidatus Andersenbacteria bacterium RIFCSPHIGHO2_12_FULL_45_11]OGY33144.1 MAG: hypothetical protein A3C02_00950 [Candidatus Andersenbacteria bacterium RIFCSPHIGHO2_02_FULL_45_11]